MKEELARIDRSVEQRRCFAIAPSVWRQYETFTFLRDPVERALSAYQEVSIRLDGLEHAQRRLTFLRMPEGRDRFAGFLDCVEKRPWDAHVRSQCDLIGSHPIDFWGHVETIGVDLEELYRKIGAEPRPDLPVTHSRVERITKYGYSKHLLGREGLPPELIARILTVYKRDVRLIERVRRGRPR